MKRATLATFAAVLALMPAATSGAIRAEPKNDPPSELRPPRPGLPPPVGGPSRGTWVLGGLGTAMLLAALFWPRHRVPVPPPDPFAEAQQRLAALHNDTALATPAAVSVIVRRYAADAFHIEGGGLTSEEAVSGLVTRRKCPVELTNAVWRFLYECDRAKFSARTDAPDAAALFTEARRLVDELEAARAKAARTL